MAAVVVASVLVGCGGDDDDSSGSGETQPAEESAAFTNEEEATEALGLKRIQDENLNADFKLPNSDCVAEALFFGEDTASGQEERRGS